MTSQIQFSILIIEDDNDIATLLRDVFASEGYNVLCTDSAETALSHIAVKPPDLITLDLNLPGMSGSNFLHHVRAVHHWEYLPVVIISANQHQISDVRHLVQGVVLKPFCLDELLSVIDRLATSSRKNNVPLLTRSVGGQ